jgi:hypothetical protein
MTNILEQEMHSYFVQLTEPEQISVLQLLKTFIHAKKSETLTAYNDELEKADEAIEAGDFILHDDVVEKYKSK